MYQYISATITCARSLAASLLSLKLEYQIYLLAACPLLLSIVFATSLQTHRGIQQTLLLLSSLGFAIGFSVWCWPTFSKAWSHPIGKALITLFHVFVLLLATAFARSIVASSLGLPPQDFDMTVAFISLLSYIPAWSIIISIVLGGTAIILQLVAFVGMYIRKSFRSTAISFARMMGADVPPV